MKSNEEKALLSIADSLKKIEKHLRVIDDKSHVTLISPNEFLKQEYQERMEMIGNSSEIMGICRNILDTLD